MVLTMAYFREIGMLYCSITCRGYMSLRMSTVSLMMKHGSAGIIVIGDEILKGQVADTNSHFIAQHLFNLGIKVSKISVIGDLENEIAEEVQLFSKMYTYVIATGGIGPTHDDVTYSGVAKAFGEKVKPHPELVKICADFYRTQDLNSPAMKLAHVPESAKLTYGYDKIRGRRTLYPSVSVHNVYIFPGIPNLMERLFLAVYKEIFKEGRERMHVKHLYLGCTEVEIADQLNLVVSKYPDVIFGSYPKMFYRFYKVHVTIQSVTKEDCEKAYNDLLATLPKECIVNYDSAPTVNAYYKIMNFGLEKKKKHVQNAMENIEQFCKIYRPSEISVVCNGDPESLVLMHLIHGCLRKNSENVELNGVHFIEKAHSSEMEKLIKETEARYRMRLERFTGPLSDTLCTFIDSHDNFKVVFVGRDWHKRCEKYKTSIQWVNPLKDWEIADIWDFIYSLYLPYSTFHNNNK